MMKMLLKTPKGMRDHDPRQMQIREHLFKIITDCFKSHGAKQIDTPVCELRQTLTGKYGEEAKLIYNLEDQGGEILSLRYDLTVPFARYLGQNKIKAMKRYQISKVYRRDNISITKGRFREFFQCDFDIAGNSDTMLADSECIKILCDILQNIKLNKFVVKINHRKIINGMFEICGVPSDKFKTICSSIDKLDKMSWEEVRTEMCTEKALDQSVADKIGQYVSKSGGKSLIDELLASEEFSKNQLTSEGLKELRILFEYAREFEIDNFLKFDLSLARGLDYYTGLIYEAVLQSDQSLVGSIAAGGRYDNLVSSLLGQPNFNVPCVGFSIGVERILATLEMQENALDISSNTQLYVGSIGEGMILQRLKLINMLWSAGFRAEHSHKEKCKMSQLFQTCEKEKIPFAVFFGPKDLEKNSVIVKSINDPEDRTGEEVKIDELVLYLKTKLNLNI